MRYCTPLLLNAMLALGCHFTAHPLARKDKADPDTAGDHFFNECKRLILENDEHVTPRLTTVQALALMSVREAGCAREERGWSYSGMSFRMGIEMGLNLDLDGRSSESSHHEGTAASRQRAMGKGGRMNEEELDARRITFWGCFLFDKCVFKLLLVAHLIIGVLIGGRLRLCQMLVKLHGSNASAPYRHGLSTKIHHHTLRGRCGMVPLHGRRQIHDLSAARPNPGRCTSDYRTL